MRTIETTLATQAIFSDDGHKRYLLKKTWNTELPKLAIVMLFPSEASGIELDSTTALVLNNASRYGFGSVSIVNLFATLNDYALAQAEEEDPENLDAIVDAAQTADLVIYASGTGKAKTKVFQQRQKQVLEALQPYEDKLKCLCNEEGKARLQHPLSPAVRNWYLSPLKISELLPETTMDEPKQELVKKKGRPKVIKKGLAT